MRRGVLIFAVAILGACGRGSTTEPTPVPGPTPSSSLISVSLCCGSNVLEVSRSRQMEARATYADGSIVDVTRDVTAWQSSDPTIASISGTGLVQSRREGFVEFRATYGGMQGAWSWEIIRPILPGPPQPAEIIGRVREITSINVIEIPYAKVEISGGTHNGLTTAASDAGTFRIDGLTEAGFDLRITKSGYRPLTVRVDRLGTDVSPATVMEPEPSMMSEQLEGPVCWPQRTITALFTSAHSGFIRITSLRGSSVSMSLLRGTTVLERHLFVNTEYRVDGGHTYELRVTGSCDYDPSVSTRITYLRPR